MQISLDRDEKRHLVGKSGKYFAISPQRLRGSSASSGQSGGRYSVERRFPNVKKIPNWGLLKDISRLPMAESILGGVSKPAFLGQNTLTKQRAFARKHNMPKITRSYPASRFKSWGDNEGAVAIDIGKLPSAEISGKYPTGGRKQLLPQKIAIDGSHFVSSKSSTDSNGNNGIGVMGTKSVFIDTSRRAMSDNLRNLQYRGAKIQVPVLDAIRNRVKRMVR